MGFLRWTLVGAVPLLLIQQYIHHNDAGLTHQPRSILKHSPKRLTDDDILVAAKQYARSPVDIREHLPPKTGRRYIVVGGAGFLGGWIVLHLLARGEDPKRIRVIDKNPPSRSDLLTGPATQVTFLQADVTDAHAITAAFHAVWPSPSDCQASSHSSESEPEITVFHCAAAIRFWERFQSLIPLSAPVNIGGTVNIIAAARSVGATVLVFTSSGSVAVRRTRLWLWPWEKHPENFVQVLDDDDSLTPTQHGDFFSNYAATKVVAERIVRDANGLPTGQSGVRRLRTGCIRPGNGVYGPGGDLIYEAYLVRKQNPCWLQYIIQSHIYVENASLAHLCYERCLIPDASDADDPIPDIGGQAFVVTDPGAPPSVGDLYRTLEVLDNDTHFIHLSPTVLFFAAHIIEFLHVTRYNFLNFSSIVLRALGSVLPDMGHCMSLQPATFQLANMHLIFKDTRAMLPMRRGGIGYQPPFTTMQAMCKLVEEHHKSDKAGSGRSMSVGIRVWFAKGKKKVVEIKEQQLDLVSQSVPSPTGTHTIGRAAR